MPATRTHYDAVIIGSGHNGLVAAAYLARAGQSVLVLERNDWLGGATASQRVFPDYDAYLSRYSYLVSLLPPVIVQELELGFETRRRRTASFTPYTAPDGSARGLVLSNVDEARSRASMLELTGTHAAWERYQRLLALEAALAARAWPSLLEPLRTRAQFEASLATADEREAWAAFVERPLGEALEHHADHDVLRGLLMTDGKIGVFTHPHDPTLLQNRCFLYHVIGNGTGEWRVPVGGMRALVEALLVRGREAGAEYLVEAPATRVHVGGTTHAVSFTHAGRECTVDADRVLVNAAPRAFAQLLDEPWTPRPTDEGSVIKVNMLLRRLPAVRAAGVSPTEAFAGSFHIDEGYGQMQASYEAAARGELPVPAPAEIYCHTLTDDSILSPELRAQGYHTLTLFGLDMPYRLFANGEHDARKERVKQLYLEGLDRICAEPFADCLARDREGNPCLEVKSPQDIEREVGHDLGNIFHDTLSWFFTDDATQAGTWGVETRYPRIYRCGSSAVRGGAVSGIPGRNTVRRILDEVRGKR
ncbi:MAG: NAD(P)/FAD-dependent oxidoreductase [Gemmatimonadales bacterium]|nr:NAD(P)/FAD-dependent oxidoreductase [Gemmatimonadales bacterium]